MITHQGEIIEQKVRESGMTIKTIAQKSGMSRDNLYDVFKRQKIDPYVMLRIGKAIDHDFTAEFPEVNSMVAETGAIYENTQVRIRNLEKEIEIFKKQCFELMEQNRILLAGKLFEYFQRYPAPK